MIVLAKIATIRAGAPFRERIVHEPDGKYGIVQGKDVGSDGTLVLADMARIAAPPGRGTPDILSSGEVVLQTRGISYRAAVVPQASSPLIAAGSLFVLSAEPALVEAEYLVFFLNLPGTQATLRRHATGSTIPNLRRSVVEQLEVALPSMSDQRQFIELSRLVRKQSDIEGRLQLLRLQELQALTVVRARNGRGAARSPIRNQR